MTSARFIPSVAAQLQGELFFAQGIRAEALPDGYQAVYVDAPDTTPLVMYVPKVLLQPAMPPEPEPGVYQIDGVMAVRFGADDSVKRWAVVTPGYVGGFSWFSWETLMQRHPDPQIVPLVPAQSTVDASVVAVQQPGGGAS
jgi:hypothetical protein